MFFKYLCITLLSLLFAVVALCADASPSTTSQNSAVAAPAKRDERVADAISFAYDWLTDLDNQDFASAIAAFHSFESPDDKAAMEKALRSLRGKTGAMSSRALIQGYVFAEATDDSECKMRVELNSVFKSGAVKEIVELWWVNDGRPLVVTAYRLGAVSQ